LNVTYAPTIVYFNRQGEEIIRSDSYFRIFHTQSVMDYVLSEAYRDEPSFQRYLSARAGAIREKGIDVDLLR
jgi:thioredoxin-related protein